MEKRSFKRIAVNLQARLFWGSSVYPARVINLSEGGMFICTKMCPPYDSVLETVILLEDKVLKIPVNVRWIGRWDSTDQLKEGTGIGVELLNKPPEYLEFVRMLRSKDL